MASLEYYTQPFSWASDYSDTEEYEKDNDNNNNNENDDGFTVVVNKRKLKRQKQFHFQDQLLVCTKGNHQFVFTVEEQLYCISNGLEYRKYCRQCK